MSNQRIKPAVKRQSAQDQTLIGIIILLTVAIIITGIIGSTMVINQISQSSRQAGDLEQLHICADIMGYRANTKAWDDCMAGH